MNYLNGSAAKPISLTFPLQEKPYVSRTMFPFFDGLIPEGWLMENAEKVVKAQTTVTGVQLNLSLHVAKISGIDVVPHYLIRLSSSKLSYTPTQIDKLDEARIHTVCFTSK